MTTFAMLVARAFNLGFSLFAVLDVLRASTSRIRASSRFQHSMAGAAGAERRRPAERTANFDNVSVGQVLDFYKNLSTLDLNISPEVKELHTGIKLQASNVGPARAAQLIEQALLEQAGVVITTNGGTATVT